MRSDSLDRELHRILYAVAALLVVEPLLLLAVLVVNARHPAYTWIPVTAWIAVTVAFVAWVFWDLHRQRIGIIARPAMPAFTGILVGLTGATVILVVLIAIDESRGWLWLILYLVAVVAMIAWGVRWQATRLAFECTECTTVFQAPPRTWLFSLNMGTHKRVHCPNCNGHWARIVGRPSEGDAAPV